MPSGGFAAECRAEVSNVEWMKAHSTLKASAPGAAVAGRSPAERSQQHGAQQQMRAVSCLQLM